MEGATLEEAFGNFSRPIQNALHCVTEAKLGSSQLQPDLLQVLTFQHGEPVPLRRPDNHPRLFLGFTLRYRLVQAADRSGRGWFQTEIDGYMFTIFDNWRQEVLSFHWDPRSVNSRSYPHLHIGSAVLDTHHRIFDDSFSTLHIPTGWVAIEDVVRFVIEELEVVPRSDDWEEILNRSKAAHLEPRSPH